jgi:replicative DNA helicase
MTARAVTPPNDLDAEGAVLSAVLLSPTALAEVQGVLRTEDFYSDSNRSIWEAIEALDLDGAAVDAVTVAGRLRNRGELERIGGTPYLAQLTDATPDIGNVLDHARTVAGKAHQRRLIATLKRFAAEGYGDVGDPIIWGQCVEQGVYDAARFERKEPDDGSLSAIVPPIMTGLLSREDRRPDALGIPTGFAELDKRLGRLIRGLMYIVAGRPGMGKTVLAGQIATNVASLGYGVIEISTEQPREQLVLRKLCQGAGVQYSDLEEKDLDADSWTRVIQQSERLRRLPMTIDFMPGARMVEIRAAIRRAAARINRNYGERDPGLIVIDQLNQINAEPQRGESTENQVSRLSKSVCAIAGEFGCPVILVAQLNRGVEHRPNKRPNMSDLRDSGQLEQDAYGILFPFRPAYYQRQKGVAETGEPEACEVIVAKVKNRSAGSVPMTFVGKHMTFVEEIDYVRQEVGADELDSIADNYNERYP